MDESKHVVCSDQGRKTRWGLSICNHKWPLFVSILHFLSSLLSFLLSFSLSLSEIRKKNRSLKVGEFFFLFNLSSWKYQERREGRKKKKKERKEERLHKVYCNENVIHILGWIITYPRIELRYNNKNNHWTQK